MEKSFKNAEDRMKKTIEALLHEFSTLRTGRASLALLDGIEIECYGVRMPLNQVATCAVPEARLITIQPWDKSTFDPIIKSIQSSNLGLNPMSDGKIIRLSIPQPTEERRNDLIKVIRRKTEEARVSIRNIRREANEEIKKQFGANESDIPAMLFRAGYAEPATARSFRRSPDIRVEHI